jgi:hypothetical protein
MVILRRCIKCGGKVSVELLEENGEEQPNRFSYFPEFVCRNLRKNVWFLASGPAIYFLRVDLAHYGQHNLAGYITRTSLKGLGKCTLM